MNQISVIDRAIKALDVNEVALRALVQESAGISAVTNPAGNAQAMTARMKLRSTRVRIDKTGKEAREDASAFCKAVIAQAAEYTGIIEPEEDRLHELQLVYSAKVIAERNAKIEAENARLAAIQQALNGLRAQLEFGDTSVDVSIKLDKIQAAEITMDVFADEILQAQQIKSASIAMLTESLGKIQAAEKLAEQREIEAARIRVEADRLAEKYRIEVAAVEAKIAAERAENARIEKERQAEIERLTELARIEKAARDKLEADERNRQAEIVRAENERLAKIEAEKQAEERAARIAAEADAARLRAEAAAAVAAKMAEDCARVEAERKAAAAPDRDKLLAFRSVAGIKNGRNGNPGRNAGKIENRESAAQSAQHHHHQLGGIMTIKYFTDLIQGSDDWLQARIGQLTASEMKLIITPGKLQYAVNDKSRAHVNEIAAQRITNFCEPSYIGDDMLRGQFDEVEAKIIYNLKYAKTTDCGFITSSRYGFTIGYSPDALVGDDGLIECKSRRQKYQVETIVSGEVPEEYMLQLQTGLLVTERDWIDFISFSGGMPMFVKRVYPDATIQSAILSAAAAFEDQVAAVIEKYEVNSRGFFMTERKSFDDEITANFDLTPLPAPTTAGIGWDRDAPGSRENFLFGSIASKPARF